MTEVFASARDMLNNDGAFVKLSRGLGEKISQVISKTSEPDRYTAQHATGVQHSYDLLFGRPSSPQSILDYYGDEARRLASFESNGGWKLAKPTARSSPTIAMSAPSVGQ
jgi:hypothetical protein